MNSATKGRLGTYSMADDMNDTFLLANFFQNNDHLDPFQRAAICALKVGESYTGDEGAGGTWTIVRVS